MPGRSVNPDILFNTIKEDHENGTSKASEMLKQAFPGIGDSCDSLASLFEQALMQDNSDKASLVVTAPPSFSINARTTMSVVRSMLEEANSSISITGYSLSSYFADLVDVIIQKSLSGVFVKFFVNDIDNQESIDKLLRYKGRFLKIYNYKKSEDSMAALHAKMISVDQKKTFITSANLSYHGQQGNIELGMLVESKKIAKQVDDMFTKLIYEKIFIEC